MINIKISDEVKESCSNVVLGVLQAKVNIASSSETLLNEIEQCEKEIKEKLKLENLTDEEEIKAGRDAYKSLGKSPSKYRLSSEALLRRIIQGKGLYKVNNIVDINNLISIKSRCPVGSYNIENIKGNIVLIRAKSGEKYKGIGKDFLNIEYLPVLVDNNGAFGSPTSDSERAMITNTTREIIMCIYNFSGKIDMNNYLNEAKILLEKYAQGSDFKFMIVK